MFASFFAMVSSEQQNANEASFCRRRKADTSTEDRTMTRAEEILKNMTLEQKIAQLQCTMSLGEAVPGEAVPDGVGEVALLPIMMGPEELAKAVEESVKGVAEKGAGIPPLMHVESLTGLSAAGATVFPTAIGLGSTFDPELVGKVAEEIHDEIRAVGYHQALAPVLDVCRDPRWGRVGETYGEDPTLSSMMGVAYVKALQGPEKDHLCATGKHFLGYGMSSGGINMATCTVPPRELREVYAKPFQAAITEGNMHSVMNSYGTIDGEMVIGSQHILTDLLRKEMEFDGIVVSDYGSIEHLVDHRLASDMDLAGRKALNAGLDVECPQPVGFRTSALKEALEQGKLSMDTIDRAVLRVLDVKLALGLMDGKGMPDRSRLNLFGSEKAFETSLQAARESIVLLKNDGILPLKKDAKKIAVIGPHADSVRLLFGGYTYAAGMDMMIGGSFADQAGMESSVEDLAETMKARQEAPRYPGSNIELDHPAAMQMIEAAYPMTKTILKSIREMANPCEVIYERGCDIAGNDRTRFDAAVHAAYEADLIIMTVGGKYGWGGSCTIGEGIDSDRIGIPGIQEELALRLAQTGTPLILVHMDARPFASPALAEKAAAVLECWFPGTTGGLALAEVLFGEYNPAGRLSMTAPRSEGQLPVYHSQYIGNSYTTKHTPTSSCRYVDSTAEPLYCFGHGLSYSEFSYRDLIVETPEVPADGSVTVSCRVKNTGSCDGEEVVQLYVSDEEASMLRPFREFAGCARVFLHAGEEKTIRFTMRADQFAFVGTDQNWVLEEGKMGVYIGSSSDDIRLQGTFRISETAAVRPAKRGFYAKTEIK